MLHFVLFLPMLRKKKVKKSYLGNRNKLNYFSMGDKKIYLLILAVFVILLSLHAQEKSGFKFGKVTNADFGLSADKFDSGANVIFLADIGTTSYEGNDKGF